MVDAALVAGRSAAAGDAVNPAYMGTVLSHALVGGLDCVPAPALWGNQRVSTLMDRAIQAPAVVRGAPCTQGVRPLCCAPCTRGVRPRACIRTVTTRGTLSLPATWIASSRQGYLPS